MADIEQEGVSPATAGGASAPDLRAVGSAIQRAVDELRRVCEANNNVIRDAANPPAASESGTWRVGNRNPRNLYWSNGLDEHRGVMFDPADGPKVVAALNAYEVLTDVVDPRDAEIERLRAANDELNAHLNRMGSPAIMLELADLRQDLADARTSYDVALREGNEARTEWKRADAEVTRLKRLVGSENVPYDGWDGLSRHDAIVRCEEGWQEYRKVRDERDRLRRRLKDTDAEANIWSNRACTAEAERDRLRAQWDAVGNGLALLRQNFTAAVNGLLPKPAEPRRWVSGDPEPAIGATVSTGKFTYTRGDDGHWRRDDGRAEAYTWKHLTHYTPVVEVVSTDG